MFSNKEKKEKLFFSFQDVRFENFKETLISKYYTQLGNGHAIPIPHSFLDSFSCQEDPRPIFESHLNFKVSLLHFFG